MSAVIHFVQLSRQGSVYSGTGTAEKGGNPDLIRESQKRRYQSTEQVDKVIELDKQWRNGVYISV